MFTAARWLSSLALALVAGAATAAGHFPMYASWDQPGGPGSPITLTYSYDNLFDGSLRDPGGTPLDTALLRSAFQVALADYTKVLPIHFVEIADAGPAPETGEYDPAGLADIRIGQVPHVDGANAYAYFPFSAQSGLAGDIVFNAGRFGAGWTPIWFYAVAQHELGHSLGMGHFVEEAALAGSSAQSVYTGPLVPIGQGMVDALQAVYGAGVGSVTPLTAVPESDTWPMMLAGGVLVTAVVRGRRRKRSLAAAV